MEFIPHGPLLLTMPNPHPAKEKHFVAKQNGYMKDVRMCFDILQARWAINRGFARLWNDGALRGIMMTCIILHNIIVVVEIRHLQS